MSIAETNGRTDAEVGQQLRAEHARLFGEMLAVKEQAELRGIPLRDPAVEGEPEPFFAVVNASELAAGNYKTSYLIPGILAEHQATLLAGLFKTLKTSFGLDMAISLASGEPLLGKFSVPERKRTLVLTAESGLATIKETCLRICCEKEIELSDQKEFFSVTDRVPQLKNSDHIGELEKIIESEEFSVVIADPAYLMIDGADAGNVFSMGEQLGIFAEIAKRTKSTPILIHHAKKNSNNATEYQPLELADLAWAGFAEFARQWILLSRRERYAEGTGEHRLWMSVGGSAGHNGCWGVDVYEGNSDAAGGRTWCVTVNDAKEARDAAEQQREEAREAKKKRQAERYAKKLRDAFIGVGRSGMTKSDAYDKAGLNPASGNMALAVLLGDGTIESCSVKKLNGHTYDGYRLTYKEAEAAEKESSDDLF